MGAGLLLVAAAWPGSVSGVRPLRSESNLVLIPATVVDNADHFVSDLRKDDFQLFDRGKPQQIASLSIEDAPISACIVFDVSRSMTDSIGLARQALRKFLDTANPADEFCVIAVRGRPELSLRFVPRSEEVADHLTGMAPDGRTALLDAVYLAAAYVRNGRNPRKALLVVSDGEDNNSRYTEREVLRVLREADVTLYSIGTGIQQRPFSPDDHTQTGPDLLTDLAESNGGRYFEADRPSDIPDVIRRIDIRYQYVIGYAPSLRDRDGKYHRVELKLARYARQRHLRALCRPGYYAPLPGTAPPQ